MARPLRIQYANALYHVFSRGERKEDIYYDDRDRGRFMELVNEMCLKYSTVTHCYTLMRNHYHLLLQTPLPNLSEAIHFLNTAYSNFFKARHNLIGSVFQGRYKAILVEKENYFETLGAYIHLNPIRAGICSLDAFYPWSSLPVYLGQKENPFRWLKTDELLKGRSANEYKRFLRHWQVNNRDIDSTKVYGTNGILGDEEFQKKIQKKLKDYPLEDTTISEIPDYKAVMSYNKEDIISLFFKLFHVSQNHILTKRRNNHFRVLFLYALKKYTNLSLKEIASVFDIKYNSVHPLLRSFNKRIEESQELKAMKQQIDLALEGE
ncbi:MAG TPA: transposase [Candidatus Mcinerneyibacteriales bacterium]|nr:transposase [Candidatus Mcinerneyibacteriales bacterium]